MKIVILDNGHGKETPGKRSPVWSDGKQLFEWEFNRDIVRRIAEQLKAENIPFSILVPETNDVTLGERCRRANAIHAKNNKEAFLVSVHANAGGGTGWECYTSVGNTKSDAIATTICDLAKQKFPGEKMRFDYSDGDPDQESQFYILKNTNCPAILTENFFMDNEKDCRFIMSNNGRQMIADLHVAAIKKVIGI